jgi:hypothetical protein
MNIKILCSIIIAFSISFSFFIIFQHESWNSLDPQKNSFFQENTNEFEIPILILGASNVGMLNVTNIQLSVDEQNKNIEIYNLAIAGDKPSKRFQQMNEIISMNPKIVLYGIGMRDFASENYPSNDILPDPSFYLSNFLSDISPSFLDNPKLTTLNYIKNFLNYKNLETDFEDNTPFFRYDLDYQNVVNLIELENNFNKNFQLNILKSDHNKEFKLLNEMFTNFSDNNIQIILVITPHNSYFVDSVSEINKKHFFEIIQIFESDPNVNVFSLMNKYSNMNIWVSDNHITHSSKGKIYDKNISEIIYQILEKN